MYRFLEFTSRIMGQEEEESDPDRLQADVMLMTKKGNVFIAYK